MKVKLTAITFIVSAVISSVCFSGQVGGSKFPDGPNSESTPGIPCTDSNVYRYPEKIKYCARDVSSSLKNQIIAEYDQKYGFNIRRLPRGDFKIDHFIPLSIGGSNHHDNLWPQHKSVYAYSDPLESEVANLIATAKIKQAKAIEVIKDCKLNLGRCAELHDYLKSLYK